MMIIILAAGFGNRLGQNKSKGLVALDGQETFLDKHFQVLSSLSIDTDIVLVTGHDTDEFIERYQHRCTKIIRNDHIEMNNGYSLLLATDYMYQGFIVINCDVVIEADIMDSLVADTEKNSLVVDSSKGQDTEEMKLCAIHGVPYRLKKKLIVDDIKNLVGEFTGICKITDIKSIGLLTQYLHEYYQKGKPFYWEDAIEEHMSIYRYGLTYTMGRKWLEVDFPEDLEHARRMFGFAGPLY